MEPNSDQNISNNQNDTECTPVKSTAQESLGKSKSCQNNLPANLILAQNQPKSKNCQYCKDSFATTNFQIHEKFCKEYSKFMKKSIHGYHCSELGCLSVSYKSKNSFIGHVKNKHLDKLKSVSDVAKPNSDQNLSINPNNTECKSTKIKSPNKKKNIKSKKQQRPNCQYCDEIIPRARLEIHVKLCETYSKFMKISDNGYDCLVCTYKCEDQLNIKVARSVMCNHIWTLHKEKFDSTNETTNLKPDKINENKMTDVEENKSPEIKRSQNENLEQKHHSPKKFRCLHCKEMIPTPKSSTHAKLCKIYSKFMKVSSNGYDCLVCTFKSKMPKRKLARNVLYFHIKTKHYDRLKRQKKEDKENIKVDSVLVMAELNSDLDIKIELTDLKDSDIPKENTSQKVPEEPDILMKDMDQERRENDKLINLKATNTPKEKVSQEVSEEPDISMKDINQESHYKAKNKQNIENKGRTNLDQQCENKPSKNQGTKKCDHCGEMIYAPRLSIHVNQCKIFSKFLKISADTYDCLLCAFKCKKKCGRNYVYQHITSKHGDRLNFEKKADQPNSNKDMELNDEEGKSTPMTHTSQKNDKGIDKNPLKNCEICNHVMPSSGYPNHIKTCKAFSSFMRIFANGYECLLCPYKNEKTNARLDMKQHLKDRHPNRKEALDISQPNQGNYLSKKKCEYCGEVVNHSNHYNACKIYYKFVKKSDGCYNCTLCANKRASRNQIYTHIRQKHKKEVPRSVVENHHTLVKDDSIMDKFPLRESTNLTQGLDWSPQDDTDQGNSHLDINSMEIESSSVDSTNPYVLRPKTISTEIQATTENSVYQQEQDINKYSQDSSILNESYQDTESPNISIPDRSLPDKSLHGECIYCQEMVDKDNFKNHVELCKEASKYINGQTCLICDIKFSAKIEVMKHIKQEHLQSNLLKKLILSSKEKGKRRMKKCVSCKEMILSSNLSQHLEICKEYEEFLNKSSSGYECNKCSYKCSIRGQMYQHIKEIHRADNHDDLMTIQENPIAKEDKLKEETQYQDISTLDGAILDISALDDSNLNDSTRANATLNYSNLDNSSVNNSTLKYSTVKNSTFSNSTLNNSTLNDLTFSNSIVDDSTKNTTLSNTSADNSNIGAHGWSKNGCENKFLETTSSTKECTHCKEKVSKDDLNSHIELCKEITQFMEEQTCLICDIEFNSTSEVAKHIENNHLDIIVVKEGLTKNPSAKKNPAIKPEVKQEIIDVEESTEEQEDIGNAEPEEPTTIYSTLKNSTLNNSTLNTRKKPIKNEVKQEIIDVDIEEVGNSEPQELTTIYTCPMCFKKYGSLPDVETHISVFHRIPLKVQRQSLQGGKSMAIITQSL